MLRLGRDALAGRVILFLGGRDTTGDGVEGDSKAAGLAVVANGLTLGVIAAEGCLALFAECLTGSLGNVGLGAGFLDELRLGTTLGLVSGSLGLGGRDLMATCDLGCSSLLGDWGLVKEGLC